MNLPLYLTHNELQVLVGVCVYFEETYKIRDTMGIFLMNSINSIHIKAKHILDEEKTD